MLWRDQFTNYAGRPWEVQGLPTELSSGGILHVSLILPWLSSASANAPAVAARCFMFSLSATFKLRVRRRYSVLFVGPGSLRNAFFWLTIRHNAAEIQLLLCCSGMDTGGKAAAQYYGIYCPISMKSPFWGSRGVILFYHGVSNYFLWVC